MCGCVASQRGTQWPVDGGRPGLWLGPVGLLPSLQLRIQPLSAHPPHCGTIII